jgi:hypothetical protein
MRFESCVLLFILLASKAVARIGHENVEERQEQQQLEREQQEQKQRHTPTTQRRIQRALGNKVKDQYLVRISKNSELGAVMDSIVFMNPFCSILYTYMHVFEGFCVTEIPEEFMEMFMVLNQFDIMTVEEDKEQKTFQQEGEVEWGLDRIDQVSLPLDGTFKARSKSLTGRGVDIYVIDVSKKWLFLFVLPPFRCILLVLPFF